jgi:hypothetical protein
MFTEIEDILEQNQKNYNVTMKRAVKEYSLIMSDISRNKRISSKRAPR